MSALTSACILGRSGDVGIGLNVRRMQTQLMGSFTTAYSLRPVGDVGSVFRRFPEPWKVFVEDPETQGRYVLAAERESRPAGGHELPLYSWQVCGAAIPSRMLYCQFSQLSGLPCDKRAVWRV
jgi:hypothetical protein